MGYAALQPVWARTHVAVAKYSSTRVAQMATSGLRLTLDSPGATSGRKNLATFTTVSCRVRVKGTLFGSVVWGPNHAFSQA